MDCQWWSSTPARRSQDGLNVLHVLSLMSQWLMSGKLNRPPESPELSQKNSNLNEKTITYPGFELGTSELAVVSHNHCTSLVCILFFKS
jgi:hypothetical protein